MACFPNGIAKIATISELPNIFASFFRKILSKMFCRQSSAVESSALLCFPFCVSLVSVFCRSLPNFSARHLQRIGFPPYVHSTFMSPLTQPLTRTCTSLIASLTALHVAHRLTHSLARRLAHRLTHRLAHCLARRSSPHVHPSLSGSLFPIGLRMEFCSTKTF